MANQKNRKRSKKIVCPICGKIIFARGYKSHIRLKHHIKVTEVVKEIYKFNNLEEDTEKNEKTNMDDVQNNIIEFERFIQEWYLDNGIDKIGFETLKVFKDKIGLPDLKKDDTITIGMYSFIKISKSINKELNIEGESYLITISNKKT